MIKALIKRESHHLIYWVDWKVMHWSFAMTNKSGSFLVNEPNFCKNVNQLNLKQNEAKFRYKNTSVSFVDAFIIWVSIQSLFGACVFVSQMLVHSFLWKRTARCKHPTVYHCTESMNACSIGYNQKEYRWVQNILIWIFKHVSV